MWGRAGILLLDLVTIALGGIWLGFKLQRSGKAAIRILLHGKEGEVGLMPPMGTVLDDAAIAGVLTYIRRSWGNEADPVTPASVAEVRGSTLGRTVPYTDETLNERG